MDFEEAKRIASGALNELADLYPDAALGYQLAGRPVADIIASRVAEAFVAHDHSSSMLD